MSQFRNIDPRIVEDEGFAPEIRTLLLVQVENHQQTPEPIHHLRPRWSIRLYSNSTAQNQKCNEKKNPLLKKKVERNMVSY